MKSIKGIPLVIFLPITVFIVLGIFVWFTPQRKDHSEVIINNEYVRSVYLGRVAGNAGYAYKVTIDSIQYILVKCGEGVTIARHSK